MGDEGPFRESLMDSCAACWPWQRAEKLQNLGNSLVEKSALVVAGTPSLWVCAGGFPEELCITRARVRASSSSIPEWGPLL